MRWASPSRAASGAATNHASGLAPRKIGFAVFSPIRFADA